MARIRSPGPALMPARWLGGGAVALVHLAFLFALLLTDKLALHHPPDARPMTVYRLPEEPMARRPAPSATGTPSRVTSLPSVAMPHLDGPMILVRPDRPQAPGLPGTLDLSVKPGAAGSLGDLAAPSRERQFRQFFIDSGRANRLAREPSAGEDCQTQLAKDRDLGAMSGGYHDPLPMQTVCTPRLSAKELDTRNERFSPP